MSRQQMNPRETRQPIIPAPETTREKIIFAIGLTLWFMLLSTPCAMVWLASGGEVYISQDVPDKLDHPRLQMQLISDADYTGFRVTRSWIASESENNLCLETHNSYALWNNRTDEDPSVVFCDCYERESVDDRWLFTTSETEACP